MTPFTRTPRFTPWLRPTTLILLAAPLVVPFLLLDRGQGKSAAELSLSKTPEDVPPADFEVRFTDDSVLKLSLRDKGIRLTTRYGKVVVPAKDIRYIDFATRIPDRTARRLVAAVAKLGSPKFAGRQAGSAELLELREKAYTALLKAARHKDLEVARRADALLKQLREQVPADQLIFRKDDVIHTVDSCITGRIDGESIKALTFQFGEVGLKPGHMRSLQYTAIDPNPGHIEGMRNLIGKTFRFKVTGALDGAVFGSGVYTSHSALAAAVVHAGLLKAGDTAVVRVTFVAPPNALGGTMQNGITSSPFGQHGGAFVISK
jgi:hypothetical protein